MNRTCPRCNSRTGAVPCNWCGDDPDRRVPTATEAQDKVERRNTAPRHYKAGVRIL